MIHAAEGTRGELIGKIYGGIDGTRERPRGELVGKFSGKLGLKKC